MEDSGLTTSKSIDDKQNETLLASVIHNEGILISSGLPQKPCYKRSESGNGMCTDNIDQIMRIEGIIISNV